MAYRRKACPLNLPVKSTSSHPHFCMRHVPAPGPKPPSPGGLPWPEPPRPQAASRPRGVEHVGVSGGQGHGTRRGDGTDRRTTRPATRPATARPRHLRPTTDGPSRLAWDDVASPRDRPTTRLTPNAARHTTRPPDDRRPELTDLHRRHSATQLHVPYAHSEPTTSSRAGCPARDATPTASPVPFPHPGPRSPTALLVFGVTPVTAPASGGTAGTHDDFPAHPPRPGRPVRAGRVRRGPPRWSPLRRGVRARFPQPPQRPRDGGTGLCNVPPRAAQRDPPCRELPRPRDRPLDRRLQQVQGAGGTSPRCCPPDCGASPWP